MDIQKSKAIFAAFTQFAVLVVLLKGFATYLPHRIPDFPCATGFEEQQRPSFQFG